jgi:hypothetical protein
MLNKILPTLVLAASVFAQEPGLYKGEWTGGSASGEIHITIRSGGQNPEVGFSLGGDSVTGKVLTYKIDGAKMILIYEFDAQGNTLKSSTEATVKGKTIEGTYKTTVGDQQIDSGTFKVTTS